MEKKRRSLERDENYSGINGKWKIMEQFLQSVEGFLKIFYTVVLLINNVVIVSGGHKGTQPYIYM